MQSLQIHNLANVRKSHYIILYLHMPSFLEAPLRATTDNVGNIDCQGEWSHGSRSSQVACRPQGNYQCRCSRSSSGSESDTPHLVVPPLPRSNQCLPQDQLHLVRCLRMYELINSLGWLSGSMTSIPIPVIPKMLASSDSACVNLYSPVLRWVHLHSSDSSLSLLHNAI